MSTTWFISDLHLGHRNIINFTYQDGSKLRDFATIEEHDEFVIDSINQVVRPKDRLIIVGDCVMNKSHMHKIYRINGRKTLVLGNHDPTDILALTPPVPYFEKVAGALPIAEFIVTHIPVHPCQLEYRFRGNIHGHLHGVPVKNIWDEPDPRYINVSVESLRYTPVTLEDCQKALNYSLEREG